MRCFKKNPKNQGVSVADVIQGALISNIVGFVHIRVFVFCLCDGFSAYIRVWKNLQIKAIDWLK